MLISRALASAVLSSLVSTAVAGALSRGAGRAAAEPLNAVGGHLAGAPAVLSKRMSLQSTLPGVAINLGGCLFWAAVVEAWAQARPPARAADALGRGAIAASLAYLVDYHALPARLRPGYERKLSPPQIMIIYAALAVALPLRAWLGSRPARACEPNADRLTLRRRARRAAGGPT